MRIQKAQSKFVNLSLAVLLALATLISVFNVSVNAASLTNTYIRLNRMKTGTGTSFRLVFRTVGAGATSVAINFNGADSTTWTGSSGVVNTTQTVSSASCAAETGATALPGSITAAGSGSTVTISSVTALSATTTYCVDLTSATAVTNPTSSEYHPTVTVGSDSTTVALRVIADDQVVVSATVPPTFNFVLDANTTSFTANLDTAAVRQTTGRTVTVTTNATNGWIAWAKDLNTGLTSAAAAKTIASTTPGTAATLSAGTEGYVISAEVTTDAGGGGTVSIPAAYQGTAGNNNGSGLDTTYRQIASSNGTANGDVITIRGKAAISGSTPAATDYTDTWTIIGAGTF
ncbi:MAG TPA: hypothetical protein VLG37_03610 [Candidatus Saccharimonadales bacterium]|nr:hypothetical protein [Candidatus Saccharimonadales bacterium]